MDYFCGVHETLFHGVSMDLWTPCGVLINSTGTLHRLSISILTEIFSELAQHCATLCKVVQLSQVDKLTTKPAMYRILQVHIFQFGNPSSIYSRKFCTSLQGILTLFKHFRTIFLEIHLVQKGSILGKV